MRKWPKTGIFSYFVTQRGPKFGRMRPIFSTHIKVLAISTWSNTDVKPMKTFWENEQRPEFWLILGPKMALKLDLYGIYSTHSWTYLQWACEAILIWNQWKLFEKVTKVQNFDLLWDSKWPQNMGLWGLSFTCLQNSSNELTTCIQALRESSENFSRK